MTHVYNAFIFVTAAISKRLPKAWRKSWYNWTQKRLIKWTVPADMQFLALMSLEFGDLKYENRERAAL